MAIEELDININPNYLKPKIMKKITIMMTLIFLTIFCYEINAQSTINITTSGGSYPGEKWVSITTAVDGGGTQIWGQGNGTQCDGAGLINQDIMLPPGDYYVNCYDQYDDSWDGTLINVTAYGNSIGNNVGVSPTDGADTDATTACEGTAEELEASFMITVPSPPACLPPTNLTATGINATSATLGWTTGGSGEPNWDIEVLPVATTATGVATDSNVSNAFNKTGLTAATDYKFYVRANCGGGASTWSGPFNFTTTCVVSTAPYVENFENGGTVPNCWSLSGAENWRFSNTGVGEHIGNNGVLSGATASGGYFAWVDSSLDEANAVLTSPLIDVSALTTPSLSFYEISDNEGDTNAQLLVEVYDGAAWNIVGTYTTNTSGWEQKFISLGGLTITGPIQIRFTFTEPTSADFTDDIAIDDVAVNELPTCLPPNTPNVTAITATSASLAWISGGSGEVSWDIEVLPTANTATGTPTDVGVTNPVIKNNLNPATDYKFYVRANCGAGGYSPWAGPFTFTTACGTVTPSYTQEFTTYPGACWTEGNNTDVATGPNGTDGVWAVDGFLNNGITGAARVNIFGTTDSDWLVTPTFDLSSGNYGLAFDTGVTTFSGTGAGTIAADDMVLLLISNDNGVTWVTLDTFDDTNSPSNTGDAKLYDLAAYTSATTKFAFLMIEGATSGGDINFYVDNFKVDLYSILGIEEIREIEGFEMYPNPVEDKLTISAKNEIKQLSVVNMLGQTVKTVTPNNRDYQLDLSNLTSGIYFVKAIVNNTEGTFRIVKK